MYIPQSKSRIGPFFLCVDGSILPFCKRMLCFAIYFLLMLLFFFFFFLAASFFLFPICIIYGLFSILFGLPFSMIILAYMPFIIFYLYAFFSFLLFFCNCNGFSIFYVSIRKYSVKFCHNNENQCSFWP